MANLQGRHNMELNHSDLTDTQQSVSLLPQRDNQQRQENGDYTVSISDVSQIEISGFTNDDTSGTDYISAVTDPFNSIFYHIIPSKNSSNIMFYTKPLFNSILSVLAKEFKMPGENSKMFTLKTHIYGKRCSIHIDRSDLTISATGPGHTSWRDNNFRKLTEHMFRRFVDETNSVLQTKLDEKTTTLSTTSSTNDTTVSDNEAEIVQPQTLKQLEAVMPSDSPIMKNISMLMDMVHTLQGQVSKLTNEVNKLVNQATKSLYQTVDETHFSHTRESILTPESTTNTQVVHNEDKSEQEDGNGDAFNHNSAAAVTNTTESDICHTNGGTATRLTSTPRLSRQIRRAAANPSSGSSSQPTTKPRPVPKPRQALQTHTALKKILLIGDSIVSGINQKGLKTNIYKHGIPGATIDIILDEVDVYDFTQFSHVILYVGGNNASKRTEIEYFEEKYEQLLSKIKQNSDCKVYMINSCPRGDTDITEINDVIYRLADHHQLQLIDAHHAFHNKYGEIIDRYYAKDCIHLSESGVKRLLGAINSKLEIVHDFANCVFGRHKEHRRAQQNSVRIRYHRSQVNRKRLSCSKCGETNHGTRDCKHAQQLQCNLCGYYGHKSNRCENQ